MEIQPQPRPSVPVVMKDDLVDLRVSLLSNTRSSFLPAGVEIHPLAQMIPPMSAKEFTALKENIAAHGQKEPILFYEGKILDGFNRYRACAQLGIIPRQTEFVGTIEAASLFVLTNNLARRDLSKSQKAMVLAVSSQMPAPAAAGHFHAHGTGRVLVDKLAAEYGMSHVLLYQVARIRAESPELTNRVLAGICTVGAAIRILKLQQQGQSLSKAVLDGDLSLRDAKLLLPSPLPEKIENKRSRPRLSPQMRREMALVELAARNPDLAWKVACGKRLLIEDRPEIEEKGAEENSPVKETNTEGRLQFHPLNCFPRMTPLERRALIESVRLHGLKESITLYEGMILDGRERYDACGIVGIVPKYQEFSGSRQEALDLLMSRNLFRTNLSVSQKAMIAVTTAPPEGLARRRSHDISRLSTTSGTNAGSLYKARNIMNKRPDLVPAVRDGEMSIAVVESEHLTKKR